MARDLRQSTSVDVSIGPFLDATDGVTAETGLTLTQPDIRLKKNGAAWAQKAAAQTLSHEENGFYEVTLDATDTNTLGLLRLAVFESGAAPVWEDFHVLPAHVWDALYVGTSWGEAIARGTLQSATGTTAVLASATSFADDLVNNATLVITGGTGAGQSRVITGWVSATDTATVDTWTTTPDSTSTYAVYPTPPGTSTAAAMPTVKVSSGTGTGQISLSSGLVTLAGVTHTGAVIPTVSAVTGAVGSVTGNVGGNVTGSVGSVASGGLDTVLDEANNVETGVTLRGALRLMLAALVGKASGLGTTTAVFRNAVQDSKDRITATVDSDGNRSAITTDQT